MSTFEGSIKEIHGISVDRFDCQNLDSLAFFLSHCHTDHMRGLWSPYFHKKLIGENRFLYLSDISAKILQAQIPNITNQIKILPLEDSTSIAVGDKYISITCIPAGHCPGSVMFLFETQDASILYTGDYRISPRDIKKFACFYDTFGNIKKIDKIYLDTTFFLESYGALPKREHSLSELCKIISSWTSQDPQNCVKLNVGAKYGYEYVFKEIFDICKMPIHVDEEKYNFISIIPELDQCVTTKNSLTQIHCCNCIGLDRVRKIKLSAYRWQNADFNKRGIVELDDGVFYVCYSTHASYEEGLALINFLKPKDIHVCVERPKDHEATISIKKLVEKHLKIINGAVENVHAPKLFQVREYFEASRPRKVAKIENILDSPPR